MPWTRQQVKFLLSDGWPLSGEQKTKMKGELHSNPSMGHMKKGYSKREHVKKLLSKARKHHARSKG